MIFKQIETDLEWSRANVLRNLYNWTNPITLEEGRAGYERSKVDRHDIRLIGIDHDEIVSYTMVLENQNSPNGDYWMSPQFDPNHPNRVQILREAVEAAMQAIRELGGKRGMVESRGEYGFEAELYQELAFDRDMRLPFSCIDVPSTNFSFHPQVVSFADYLQTRPDDGIHHIWRCEMDCAADLPLPFPFVETPFEAYKRRVIDDPLVDLNCKFLFEEDGVLKGLTQLWPSKVNPTLAQTGLTGVRSEYRRRGVARRMKEHAIAWGKQQGIEKIFTDNEENNPMYQLNLQLGFRHLFDFEVYSKLC